MPWWAVVSLGLALACVALVALPVIASWGDSDSRAVDDLPSVAEVVAAQAHRHGIQLPELTVEEQQALQAPPRPGSDASAFEQLRSQLTAVAEVDGVESAVFLLGEVAAVSEEAAELCPRLYAVLTAEGDAGVSSPCRAPN